METILLSRDEDSEESSGSAEASQEVSMKDLPHDFDALSSGYTTESNHDKPENQEEGEEEVKQPKANSKAEVSNGVIKLQMSVDPKKKEFDEWVSKNDRFKNLHKN